MLLAARLPTCCCCLSLCCCIFYMLSFSFCSYSGWLPGSAVAGLFPFILLCFMRTHSEGMKLIPRQGHTRTHTHAHLRNICLGLALQSLALQSCSCNSVCVCVSVPGTRLHSNCHAARCVCVCVQVFAGDFLSFRVPFCNPFLAVRAAANTTVLTRWLCLHIMHALLCPMAIWNLLCASPTSFSSYSPTPCSLQLLAFPAWPWQAECSTRRRSQDIDFNLSTPWHTQQQQ